MTNRRLADAGQAPLLCIGDKPVRPNNPLRSEEWDVRPVSPAQGRAIIAAHHYAGRASNTTVGCDGLFRRSDGALFGVAWWLPPTKPAAIAAIKGSAVTDWRAVLSLSRLVILPGAPTNAASFLLTRSAALRDDRWHCLVTWADTERGHTGGIYRAAGWEYLGLSTPTDVWLDGQGNRVTRKIGPTTRTHAQMRDLGYSLLGYFPKHRYRLIRHKIIRRAA